MLLHKKNILNLLLAIVVCSLAAALYLSWNTEIPSLPVSAILEEEKSTKKNLDKSQAIPVETTYKAVTDQNLFSPDRKEYIPEKKPPKTEEEQVQTLTKVSGKAIELQGVIQIGDKHSGLILNPDIGAVRKYKWVVVGERIGNLVVTEIRPDRLLLRDGGEKYEIKLSDMKKEKTASPSTLKMAPTIVSTGTSSKSSAAPVKTQGNNSSKETTIIHTPFGDIIKKN